MLGDVARARAKLTTLVARFTQVRALSLFATTVTSHGELTLVRPDRLRWELFEPDAITYWVGPEGVSYRSKSGRGKVSRSEAGALGAVLGDLMTVLGGDLATLRDRYSLDAARVGGGARITAAPKDEQLKKLVARLTLELAPGLVAPRRFELVESGDDKATITFDAARLGEPVDPKRMRP
ncbi:MAG: outer membrane lipoprotein carrier protein LolA [Polyangiaceae bacterium]|nr:outer membrane lipoprotein carrier protein LolA [Polyangiaceae bacterium]